MDYIKRTFELGYLMDPHTATCFKTYETCRQLPLKTIIYSTAEWTKFSPVIAQALTGTAGQQDIAALSAVANTAHIKVPDIINSLFNKPVTQKSVIDKGDIEAEILTFLN